jgi:voltage-gated potassium channel
MLMFLVQKLMQKLRSANNGFLFVGTLLLFTICSFSIHFLEPDHFPTPFDGFWWVMTTVTTVGYGDFYPHSVAGKCLGIFLYLFGIGLISIIIGKIVDRILAYKRKKEEGKLPYRGQSHFVIVHWSKHSELALQEILNNDPQAEIVLIDTLDRSPVDHDRVRYVHGNPAKKQTLDMANISRSRAVFVFADDTTEYNRTIRDTAFIDGKTLLIATTIERLYNNVYSIVEIMDKQNIDNFTHIHIDEFIVGSETISQLAVHSAFHPGASKIISQLLTQHRGEDLYEIGKLPHWSTYRHAFDELLAQGATLISDGSQLDINRRLNERIDDDARLFIICDHLTYAKLKNG